MKIAIYTIILPRKEVFFLEEWIEHHLSLGVGDIYLYENGTRFYESREGFAADAALFAKHSLVWAKKPHEDYFLEYSDEEIYDKLADIRRRFPNLHVKAWPYKGVHREVQIDGMIDCVTSHPCDWWVHVDPDEYIVPKRHGDIRSFLEDAANREHGAFHLSQRVFDRRSRSKPVKQVTNWGYDPRVKKSIFRGTDPARIKFHIHKAEIDGGATKVVPVEELVIHHYRGPADEQAGPAHEAFRGATFDKFDDSILRLPSASPRGGRRAR